MPRNLYMCTQANFASVNKIGNPLTVKIKVVIVLTSMQSKLLHCRGLGLFICLNVS